MNKNTQILKISFDKYMKDQKVGKLMRHESGKMGTIVRIKEKGIYGLRCVSTGEILS